MDTEDRPRVRSDIELLRGLDDHPLAYDPRTGVYHRLSEPAYALVRSLDGTRSLADLAGAIATRRGTEPGAALADLHSFVSVLRRAGVMDGAGVVDGAVRRLERPRRAWLMRRFVATRRLPALLEPLARPLRAGRRGPFAVAALALLGPVGMVLGVVAVLAAPPAGFPAVPLLAAALAAFAVQVCVHEATHALVAQVLGVPVRGAGVALVLWVLPYVYVDRTDAYRVRSRTARVALVLTPVLLDGVLFGATALAAPAPLRQVLLPLQALTLFMNLNPLLPSDGYAAIEAGAGLVDPRGRALTLLGCLARRRPLPPYLAALSRRARLAHLGYGIVSLVYFGFVLYATLVWILG